MFARKAASSSQPSISPDQLPATDDPREMLELLFALDRSVVEVSMQLYNVNRRDRRKMRLQNSRLHAALRDKFPHLLKAARDRAA